MEDQVVGVDNSNGADLGANKKRAVYFYTERVFKSPYRILSGAHRHPLGRGDYTASAAAKSLMCASA